MSVSLIVFGSLVAVAIAIGRVGFSFRQAWESRYTTFTLNIVIGICLFIFNKRLSFPIYKAIIAIVVFSLTITSASSLGIGASLLGSKAYLLGRNIVDYRNTQEYNKTIITDYKNRSDEELSRLLNNKDIVIRSAQIMERQELGPFKRLREKKRF